MAKLLKVKSFQEKLGVSYCGPASLKMVLEYYGIEKTEKELARLSGWNKVLRVKFFQQQRLCY